MARPSELLERFAWNSPKQFNFSQTFEDGRLNKDTWFLLHGLFSQSPTSEKQKQKISRCVKFRS